VLTLQLDGNCGWLQGRDLTLRRIVWMRMPNSPFTGLPYILVDGDATGLTDVREVGGGLRDSILVQAFSQLDGGRQLPRCLPLSRMQPVGPLEEGVYDARSRTAYSTLDQKLIEPKYAILAPDQNPAPEQRLSQLVFLVVVRIAGGTRGFVWVFRIDDLDHRHHPVVLVVEDVAVEHELPGEVGEAGTYLYRTVR
jgi:hypothetical protein